MRTTFLAACCILLSASAVPADDKTPVTVLDTSGYWRCWFTLKPPVVREASGVRPVAFATKWPERETPPPPADWLKPDFDDSSWTRMIGAFAYRPSRDVQPKSPLVAVESRRAKFLVADPAAVGGLTLSVAYKGGCVAWLNGVEIARRNLPAGVLSPETLAEDYPLEAQVDVQGKPLFIRNYSPEKEELRRVLLRNRELKDIAVPAGLLRKGVNVLAIECRRTAFAPAGVGREEGGRYVCIPWGNCGLDAVRLTASSPAALTANVARPGGLQVWNSNMLQSDFDLDYGDPCETPGPIVIAGTVGGTFSGKIVVGSDGPLKGLKATAGELRQKAGNGRIPADAVRVRVALPWGTEDDPCERYRLKPARLDMLVDASPAEIGVREVKLPAWDSRRKIDPPIVFGAVAPVWVTVRVPADAAPGDYEGALTVEAVDVPGVAHPPSGVDPSSAQPRAATPHKLTVPVALHVSAWQVPKPAEWVTFAEFIQSPDTLAIEYAAPLWSDRHFALIDRSFEFLGELGSRTLYVPLIAETNLGNAESMVRWVKKPDGSYAFDFSVMERYLDVALRRQRRPDMVALIVWDTFLEGGSYTGLLDYAPKDVLEDRKQHGDQGPEVTLLDPATGKTEKMTLPKLSAAESRALWTPLFDELRARMAKRGLDGSLTLGFTTDTNPTKGVVETMKAVAPGLPWLRQSHDPGTVLFGVPVKYTAYVWTGQFARDPLVGRDHGWDQKEMRLFFPRCGMDVLDITTHRFMGELNIAGEQRGFGRLGGDFWPVMKDKKGARVGRVSEGRFPRGSWRALNIVSSYLAPGPDGPAATARYELAREGLEECEARVFIEKALLDPALRAKLGKDLADRAQGLLDERTVAMIRGVNALTLGIHFTSNAEDRHMWWHAFNSTGPEWLAGSGWQARSTALYDAAAEVAHAIGR